MKLYRSIGENELTSLLEGQTIYGKYNCENESQNTNKNHNVCCFFVDEVRWKDANHRFLIVADIPENKLDFGIGEYFAAPSLNKTKTWSGRTGSWVYKIREAYIPSYSLKNVKEIFLFESYADWYVNEYIKPVCQKYNIKCHHFNPIYSMDKTNPYINKMGEIDPFINSSQKFIKISDEEYGKVYVTTDYNKEWLNYTKLNETKYIEEVKSLVLNSELTLHQAKQIKHILT